MTEPSRKRWRDMNIDDQIMDILCILAMLCLLIMVGAGAFGIVLAAVREL